MFSCFFIYGTDFVGLSGNGSFNTIVNSNSSVCMSLRSHLHLLCLI